MALQDYMWTVKTLSEDVHLLKKIEQAKMQSTWSTESLHFILLLKEKLQCPLRGSKNIYQS